MRRLGLLWATVVLFSAGPALATLTVIGTATINQDHLISPGGNALPYWEYGNRQAIAPGPYNLIFEGDLGSPGLVWFDHEFVIMPRNTSWQGLPGWPALDQAISTLGGDLTIQLNPAYTTTIDWSNWRLPVTVDAPLVEGFDGTTSGGCNITSSTSELSHLFYVSLGNLGYYDTAGNPRDPGTYGLLNTGPFTGLEAHTQWYGTPYALDPSYRWEICFLSTMQGIGQDDPQRGYGQGLAVVSGVVNGPAGGGWNPPSPGPGPADPTTVPVPGAIVLAGLGMGLVGWLRRKKTLV